MNIVTLSVATRAGVARRARSAFAGKKQGAHLSFASPELLWKVLSVKRWELLKAMTGQGATTIRGIARLVGRDVKAVHADVHALLEAGLLDRTEAGKIAFPYDAIRVEFLVTKAA